jgi:hypothetical protein
MKTTAAALVAAIALSGCASLPDEAVFNERFPAPYDVLAACAYEAASRDGILGLRFTDLKATRAALINMDSGGYSPVPLWEARFTGDGDSATRVEIKAFPTVFGRDLHAQKTIAHVRACAAQYRPAPPLGKKNTNR